MRLYYASVVFAVIAALCICPSDAGAQFFAAERYPGNIYSYDDTTATWVNPYDPLMDIVGVSLDHEGRLLLASQDCVTDVIRFDVETQTVELLDPFVSGSLATDVCMDLGDDIYVLKESNWKGDGGRQYESWIGILHDGMGPAVPAYVFGSDAGLLDAQVWPFGERAGNLLVLISADGRSLIEFTRAPDDSLEFVGEIVNSGMMPSGATGFAISPDGIIVIIGYDGLHMVDEEYGYVWGFGDAYGPGHTDIEIDAQGIIYLANTGTDRIERYDSGGSQIGGPFGADLVSLGAIGATGFTPTPEGEDVLVEPGENIEVTYEEVTSSGFTVAEVTVTTDRISPELNRLPAYADLPGTRADDFSYILLATDAVYEGLIQVDVLEEGTRLFYASGTSDTFRDFTVVGSIEDARGTIPRFSELPMPGGKRLETGPTEVVLVEDSRALSEATIYKFWRLELAMDVPDNMPGGDPCPWEYIEWLQKYHESARGYYDVGQYANALSELAIMNGLIRSNAGSCIPDSSDDPFGNLVAHILAHSKTLMYSIGLESGGTFTGVDASSSISLAVVNPARGECRLALSGPVGTEVAVHIYGVAGRLVATVFEGKLPEGGETVVWDGLDHAGQPIASGVYFARLESSEETQTAKLVYIR